ncbi:MAG: beta-ketoacyl synthase N-terminal-like domain-containing protein, partial [Kiritimatiellia bacterium]|nr:beta-ketoacyl synthase N-terminal-like domain-containing protein [Kiritimatiellia bacterium]
SDAAIVPTVMAGLCAGGMVSHQNDSPSTASRPFDRHRDGGILSEGSGMVILENLSHAMARGARPILEIIGFGSAADPANEESGAGLASCIREALDNATIYTHGVDGLCAHGPSDPVLDRVETQAVKAVLGNHARRIPVFSIKGVTGNPMAAGGAHQIVTSGLIVQTGQIPPTANYQYPDPDCDLDIVHSHPRCNRLKHLLINAHGSGRTNSAMIVRAFDIS